MSAELTDSQDAPVPADRLQRLADFVLGQEGYDPARTELGLALVDREAMTEMHQRYLGRRGPTDVLSLPVDDLAAGRVPQVDETGPPISAGDVFICPQEVRARADALGVGFEEHMALMVVHGVLHVLGYDHKADADADVMEGRERKLLAGFEVAR